MNDLYELDVDVGQEGESNPRFTPPTEIEKRIPFAIRISERSYETVQELGKIYGFRYASEVMERALQDALLFHKNPNEGASSGNDLQELSGRITDLEERINNLIEGSEEEEEMEEKDEESPYPRNIIEYFNNLPSDGKSFLCEFLSKNPAVVARSKFRLDWKREISQTINNLIPYTGRKQIQTVRRERLNLLNYLKEQEILPK